jgi:hypothetical protein
MKTLFLALFAAALVSDLNARIVTLTVGGTTSNTSLTIGTNESLTVISGFGDRANVQFEKDGLTDSTSLAPDEFRSAQTRWVLAGPATVRLTSYALDRLSFITVDIQPDLFPPDKTLVVPQGSAANVILESSTNLVNWSLAPPGLYTNQVVNMFFRIRAERLP